jgi:DNA ligase-1
MDLTKYTKAKENNTKKETEKEKVIIDNEDIKAVKKNDEVEFIIKTKEGLQEYQDFLFFGMTHSVVSDDEEEAQAFFEESIEKGVEGLMFKNLDSEYKPGLRTGAMAKVKETKEDIDVVILGAEHGKGKRAGFYSSFIVAVKNPNYTKDEDEFLEIGKVSSGIKEIGNDGHSMENLTNLLNPLRMSEKNGVVKFEPKIVLQVRYQEIQKSPTYKSGYALRFPRIIGLREDKDIDEINSIDDVRSFV